ncbi:5-formyltetrahydrofolate cyclo-ligase [Acaryochloris sp. IP29b_bin.148]|uniref:5-formyltetrahydrofolate cyclo-ligase n=1 Tax=Acaryochloris sp. IP29b_bin.148 TaxID=2969218 RepID=UPI002637F02A|nr:5-formyltetrahydrofolate cyclo-ligase [Acaryochloris sp. IP29b_bin.148]
MQSSDSNPLIQKNHLRRQLLTQRQSMPVEQWRLFSQTLCQQLLESSLWQQAKTVLAYMTFRQEPDLSWLFLRGQDREWGLSRCVGRDLKWHRCNPLDSTMLIKGKYGILEPYPDCPELLADEVDLILVPAVACDRNGYRLGYGGGYYDRLLASPDWSSIPTIGIVFGQDLLDQLPTEPWDQPLQAVCTEKGLFSTRPDAYRRSSENYHSASNGFLS